jgi:hypothetical protein
MYALKLPWTRVQSALQVNIESPKGPLLQTQFFDMKVNSSEFIENSGR